MFKRIKTVTQMSILLSIGKIIELLLKPLTKMLNAITESIKSISEDVISEHRI